MEKTFKNALHVIIGTLCMREDFQRWQNLIREENKHTARVTLGKETFLITFEKESR